MIETKILSDAPGIQNQGLVDKTEGTSLPTMTNAVIVGRFKRGRMDKAMVVTANNYQAVLGHDPSNPSYLALEDVFALGVRQISVLRIGDLFRGSQPSDSSDTNDGFDTNTVSFLKFQNNQQINSNDGVVGGLIYSVNGGPLQAIKEALPTITEGELGEQLGRSLTMYAFLPQADSFLPFGRDGGFGWHDTDMPNGLEVDKFYLFGLNDLVLQEFSAIKDLPQPDGVMQHEVSLTVYPANKLPAANIDYDIFDLINDPSSYTADEIAYFAAHGITPAVKNPDGSYTIKSQLALPVFEPTTEV